MMIEVWSVYVCVLTNEPHVHDGSLDLSPGFAQSKGEME